MCMLEKQIAIWPAIEEQHRHYGKIETERDLDYIAKNITRTYRPPTQWKAPDNDGYVAKRWVPHLNLSGHIFQRALGPTRAMVETL